MAFSFKDHLFQVVFFYFCTMKVDVIIVGQGIAGSIAAYKLLRQGKSIAVFQDGDMYKSSSVAPGMFNALVLKRFTLCWNATEFLPVMFDFYADMEEHLKVQLIHHFPIFRLFHDEKEVETWLEKTDHPVLSEYMDTNILEVNNDKLQKKVGFGRVKQTGRVDVKTIIGTMAAYISSNGILRNEKFDFEVLKLAEGKVTYKDIEAEKVVFSEGFGMVHNPYFNYLPLDGTKGELITIKAIGLNLDKAIKGGIFIMPLGDDLYRVGATFNWKEKDCIPTEKGKQWLLDRLGPIIDCPFEIVSHEAGMRPTVNDRRPLIGQHPEFSQLYVLNGFGTRGILMGPYLTDCLISKMYEGTEPDDVFNISRYRHFLESN